jgi:uncharacterized membrane protein
MVTNMRKPLLLCLIPLLLASVIGCAQAQKEKSSNTTFVYRCSASEQTIVVTLNGSEGYLFSKQVSQALRQEPGAVSYVGDDVYYRPAQPVDIAPGQTAEITIKGNKLTGCRNNPRAAVWEGAKLRGVSYRAIGQEPPWILEIDRDDGFLLVTRYGEKKQQFPYVEPVTDVAQRASSYTSAANGESITITIHGRQCEDSMSGEEFSSEVKISWREQILHGCGRALH